MNFFRRLFKKKPEKPKVANNNGGFLGDVSSSSFPVPRTDHETSYLSNIESSDLNFDNSPSSELSFGGGDFGGGGSGSSYDGGSSDSGSSYDSGSSDSGSSVSTD